MKSQQNRNQLNAKTKIKEYLYLSILQADLETFENIETMIATRRSIDEEISEPTFGETSYLYIKDRLKGRTFDSTKKNGDL